MKHPAQQPIDDIDNAVEIPSDQPGGKKKSLNARLKTARTRLKRKEILIFHSDAEREHLIQATQQLCRALSRFSWVKRWIPGSSAQDTKKKMGGTGKAAKLLNHYGLIKPLVLIALSRPMRRTAAKLIRPAAAARFGVIGLAGWSAWQIWRAFKTRSSKRNTD